MSFSLIVLVAYFELVILVIYTFPFMFFFPNTIVFVPRNAGSVILEMGMSAKGEILQGFAPFGF